MHAVIETDAYLIDAKVAGLSENELTDIAMTIGKDPQAGVVMPGTGGARKIRIAGRGKGKSGGYRVVSYFAADDVPVFLLALIDKGDRENLTQAERNALRAELGELAADYRAGVAMKVRRLR